MRVFPAKITLMTSPWQHRGLVSLSTVKCFCLHYFFRICATLENFPILYIILYFMFRHTTFPLDSPHDRWGYSVPSSCYTWSISPANKWVVNLQRMHTHEVCICVCVCACVPGCAVLLCAVSADLWELPPYSQDRDLRSDCSAFHAERSLPLQRLCGLKREGREGFILSITVSSPIGPVCFFLRILNSCGP